MMNRCIFPVVLCGLTALCLAQDRLTAPAHAEMPGDFLKVESKAWSKWLDERIDVSWDGVPLKDVLANQFGPAALAVVPAKALDTPITFDVRAMSRRVALWRLSQQYGFTIRWVQKDEPRMFMGLSEAEHRKHQVGGVTLTAITQVMRSDYKTYQDWKQRGQIKKEELLDGILYYAVDVDRDLSFGYATAHVIEVQRYKTTVAPEQATFEARFTAKVRWIEPIGSREAKVIPIGVDPRWLVGVEILSIEKPVERLDRKCDAILAIHSPVKTFLAEREKIPGKVYVFSISGVMRDGRPACYGAEATEKKESERK